jgi:alpha-1,3-glucosyltransferase
MSAPTVKDATPSLFVNSPVLKSLQRLVQNETLWTAPLIIIFFASFIRWIVALNPYSGNPEFLSIYKIETHFSI